MQDVERGRRIKERRMELHLTQPAVVEKIEELAWKLPRDHALHPENTEDGTRRAPLSLRGFQTYERGGGIVWEKAKLVAQVLQMDPHAMMHGLDEEEPAPEPTPDPLQQQAAPVEVRLDAVEGDLATILAAMTGQLTAQTEVLSEVRDLLQDVKDLLGRDSQTADRIEAATGALDGSAERLGAQVRQTIEVLGSAPQARPAKARKRAPKHTPQA